MTRLRTLRCLAVLAAATTLFGCAADEGGAAPSADQLSEQLASLKKMGGGVLKAYLRNVRLALYGKASTAMLEVEK